MLHYNNKHRVCIRALQIVQWNSTENISFCIQFLIQIKFKKKRNIYWRLLCLLYGFNWIASHHMVKSNEIKKCSNSPNKMVIFRFCFLNQFLLQMMILFHNTADDKKIFFSNLNHAANWHSFTLIFIYAHNSQKFNSTCYLALEFPMTI